MYCSKCGNAVHKEDLFCSRCGNRLRADERGIDEAEEIVFNPLFTEAEPERHTAGQEKQSPVQEERAAKTPETPQAAEAPKASNVSEASETPETSGTASIGMDNSEFVWNIHNFNHVEKPRASEIFVDWEKNEIYGDEAEEQAKKISDEALRRPVRRHDFKTSFETEPEILDGLDGLYERNTISRAVLEYGTISEAMMDTDGVEGTTEVTIEDIQKDLEQEQEQESAEIRRDTARIDKFYTFNQKNEEFQKLLDREYERVNRSRSGSDAEAAESKTGGVEAKEDWSNLGVFDPVEHLKQAENQRKDAAAGAMQDNELLEAVPQTRSDYREREITDEEGLFVVAMNDPNESGAPETPETETDFKRFDTKELEKDVLELEVERERARQEELRKKQEGEDAELKKAMFDAAIVAAAIEPEPVEGEASAKPSAESGAGRAEEEPFRRPSEDMTGEPFEEPSEEPVRESTEEEILKILNELYGEPIAELKKTLFGEAGEKEAEPQEQTGTAQEQSEPETVEQPAPEPERFDGFEGLTESVEETVSTPEWADKEAPAETKEVYEPVAEPENEYAPQPDEGESASEPEETVSKTEERISEPEEELSEPEKREPEENPATDEEQQSAAVEESLNQIFGESEGPAELGGKRAVIVFEEEIGDEEKEKPSGRETFLKVVIAIAAIALAAELVLFGIRYFAPDSKAAEFIYNNLSFSQWMSGRSDDDTQSDGDTEGEDGADAVGGFSPVLEPRTLEELVFNAYTVNKNVKSIQADSSLCYDAETQYADERVYDSEKLTYNLWYSEGNSMGYSYTYIDQSVVNTLVAFDSEWIDYVNNNDEAVFSLLKEDGAAYKNCKDFKNAGNVTKEFSSIKIGELRAIETGYFLWAEEEIKTTESGKTRSNVYRWVYYIEPVDNEMKIVDYFKF